MGCTINDLITSASATALSKFFKANGDLKTKEINIVQPANIRWEFYPTRESVKMENKFAPTQLRIPLIDDLQESLK